MYDGQRFIFGLNPQSGHLGDIFRVGDDQSHRLAVISDFVDGERRPVFERRPGQHRKMPPCHDRSYAGNA
jgi:hypothetical protein